MSTGVNQGVRILVERMKTNPEEFYDTGYRARWGVVLERAANAKWLTDEEHKLLDDAANELQRDRFTADVLKALTKDEELERMMDVKQMYLNPAQVKAAKAAIASGGGSGGVLTSNGTNPTWTTGAITSSNVSIGGSPVATQADIERVLAAKLKAWENEK